MENVIIRPVTVNDLDACHTVESRCFFPSEAASKENIEKRINLFPQGFFVAEVAHEVIGHINSGATHKDDITDEELKAMIGHDADGKNLVVFSLAVDPEFQKQGIARQLMLRFIDAARAMKKQNILLLCKAQLIPYYETYGFIDGGVSASTHGGFTWHEMSLSL